MYFLIFDIQDVYTTAISTIELIRVQYNTLQRDFSFPVQFDFLDQGSIVSIEVSTASNSKNLSEDTAAESYKLAYTNMNAPFHSHLESLSHLLVALDAVETGGIKKLQDQRRLLIQQLDNEARFLETCVCTVWEGWVLGKRSQGIERNLEDMSMV